ncbi:cysteine-rich receptor-like protein kinase 43 [Tasmannia lanceolata]|uniref:cysteine-rich receptor-like protein kinase 43 n=1 Tax=Tasmannia lanceolata TaxID=3420 RepID=UPI0040634C28
MIGLYRRCCCLELRKKGKKSKKGENDEDKGYWDLLFDLQTLQTATNNFSDENRLGSGGFGPVFKGRLPDGQEIAVKKLSLNSRQGLREFTNEVRLLLKVQHKNLVTLLGCCGEGGETALVYEYLPNRSLDHFLFDSSKSASLDWAKRFEIIKGIAKGLLYLHEESPVRIIHRDIKASNVLLDDKLNPKISDFGMARLFPGDDTHVNTIRISGTHGYMAPEYAMHGYLSVKSDVFSFGILVLEIVSGRKNHDRQLDVESGDLLIRTWSLFEEGKILELVDRSLTTYDQDEAAICIQMGLLCCQASVSERPDMYSVHLMLLSDSFKLPKPGKPGLQGRRGRWSSTASLTPSGRNISGATKFSTGSSFIEDTSRNSISVSFTEEGR